jgi:diacylglycerol kinase (ATP)
MPRIDTKVIVNPAAGSGAVGKEWPRYAGWLQEAGLAFDCEFTRCSGHAQDIAREAAGQGYRYLIAIGGDGTVNEVANGILDSDRPDDIALGLLGAGTAHDLAYSLNIPADCQKACSLLAGRERARIDVGVVECRRDGQPVRRFFINHASMGFTAEIVDTWKRLPNRFGLGVTVTLRTIAGYAALTTHRNRTVRLRLDGETEQVRISAVVIANGRYLADKMQVAPRASLYDGLLDAVVFGDVTRAETLKILPTLYHGTHVAHPGVRIKQTPTVSVESEERLLVEADGDIVGENPASFRVIPSALTVIA